MPYGYRRRTYRARSAGGGAYRGRRRPKRRASYTSGRRYYAGYRRRMYARSAVPYRPIVSRSVGFTPTARLKLRYADTDFDMSTAAALFRTDQVFSGNSLFDPDVTGVGIQPYLHDEVAQLWQRYRVRAAKISCYFSCSTPSATTLVTRAFIWAGVSASDLTDTDPGSNMQVKNKVQGVFNKEQLESNPRKGKLSLYMSTNRAFPNKPEDADLTGLFGGNPTSRWYFHVVTDSSDCGTASTVKMDVKIRYYCELSQRVDPAQS